MGFADGEIDIEESRRVAEIREKAVKEYKAKAAKLKFDFRLDTWIVAVTVGFIFVEYFGLDFWDFEDREKRA